MTTENSFDVFRPFVEKFGASGSPEQFYWAVNEAYHTVESDLYDRIHSSMYVELDRVWNRLIKHLPTGKVKLKVLDVGSGTGLVGHMLDRLAPGRIESLTCVEPNAAMIKKAEVKAKQWQFQMNVVHGLLSAVKPAPTFDVITINSVLHHIVDLPAFLTTLKNYVREDGVLLTAHDPHSPAWSDQVALKRKHSRHAWRYTDPMLVANAIRRRLSKIAGSTGNKAPTLGQRVNAILIGDGVIQHPMDIASIYAVTDVHVPGQPGALGSGLTISGLTGSLSGFELMDVAYYQYFGVDWTHLGVVQRMLESKYWEDSDPHGFLFASAWKKFSLQPNANTFDFHQR